MDLWGRVDELVERATDVAALHWHRLHLYAAWRWRSLGRPLDAELIEIERGAAVRRLSQPVVVKLVRDAYDGPMILLKGSDIATRYPRPGLRPSQDLDLLVPDAEAVQAALIANGFAVCEQADESHHHLPTLEWPGLLTHVEIHRSPSWPLWLTPPRIEELFDAATAESALGHCIRTLPPAHHALVLVAHIWRMEPMTRLGQLLDTVLMADGVPVGEIDGLARSWGMSRLWASTFSTARHVLLGDPPTSVLARVKGRRLGRMRKATVIESKLLELFAPFVGLPPARAPGAFLGLVGTELRPDPGETWGAHVRRSTSALTQSFQSRARRDERLRMKGQELRDE